MDKKQYLILNEKDIPVARLMKLDKCQGIFIECPHCKKLVRIDDFDLSRIIIGKEYSFKE